MNSRGEHSTAEKRGWRGLRSGGRACFLLSLLALPACRLDSQLRIAERILERYRHATAARPLPLSHVIRMKLRPERAGESAAGVGEIAWEPNRYRERVSSAGAATEIERRQPKTAFHMLREEPGVWLTQANEPFRFPIIRGRQGDDLVTPHTRPPVTACSRCSSARPC